MRLAEATRVSSRHRTAPMRARPSRTPRRPDRPSPTVRHVWLAALGLLVAGPRQARQWLQVAPEAAQALWQRLRPAPAAARPARRRAHTRSTRRATRR